MTVREMQFAPADRDVLSDAGACLPLSLADVAVHTIYPIFAVENTTACNPLEE